MADFRRDNRRFDRGERRGFDRDNSRGRFGDRRGPRRDRNGKLPMVDAVCDKCGKDCQLPFKPTEGKPVFCSECFEKKGNSRGSFGGRNSSSSGGISKEQFDELNIKLDKILGILEMIEFEDEEEAEEESEE